MVSRFSRTLRATLARKDPPVVTTLVPPVERAHVDAAGAGLYRAVHRTSLPEVLDDLRQRRAAAVMVSLGAWHPTARPALTRLVREYPNVPAFGLLLRPDPRTPQVALQLGQCGVRAVLEGANSPGWGELKRALDANERRDIRTHALGILQHELPALQPDARQFFERVWIDGRRLTTTRAIARTLHVNTSSLMSRFFRLGLPSAKLYLAMARLTMAADELELPSATITHVTMELGYSSPQSFSRHLRRTLGVSSSDFRRTYDGEGMLALYIERLVRPHKHALVRLSPTGAHEGRSAPILAGGIPMP